MLRLMTAASLLLIGTPAFAQITVLGNGLAKSCFESALIPQASSNSAIQTCTRALNEQPITATNKLATLVNRGILYMRAEKFDAALADYDKALAMAPDNGTVLLNKGAALLSMSDYDRALETLTEAIEMNPADVHSAYYNRALVREQLGDLNGAYLDLKKSLEFKPDFDLALRQLDRFVVTENS